VVTCGALSLGSARESLILPLLLIFSLAESDLVISWVVDSGLVISWVEVKVSCGSVISWVVVMVSCDLVVLHFPSQRLCQPELPWQLDGGCLRITGFFLFQILFKSGLAFLETEGEFLSILS
jgi:hypothetical protein